MKNNNLIGRIFRVVESDNYRILLEDDSGMGEPTNKFVLIEAKSIDSAVVFGVLEVSELVKK